MSINIYADTLHDVFSNGKYEGNMRLGYQSHEVENDTRDEFAAGLTFHLETASYYGLQAGATLFTTQGK